MLHALGITSAPAPSDKDEWNPVASARLSRRVARRGLLSSLLIVVMLCSLALMPSCATRRKPNLARIFPLARVGIGKRPVIVIPGLLGSELVNQRTGEIVWPALLRSSDDELDLPVSPDLAANRDGLRAGKIIDKARFMRILPKTSVFHDLLESLRSQGGYEEGDWDNPGAYGDRDTFYVFAYDWRRDIVETAREFIARVRSLKRKLNRSDLRFDLVTQSMGGLIARYAAMYGDEDLPSEGIPPVPRWAGAADIHKIFMFGTPNDGTAEAFSVLLHGYSVTSGLSRRMRLLKKLSREDALTAPSIFQLLPHNGSARFLDGDLKPLHINLYDPAVWRLYGWSAASDPKYRKRFHDGETGGDVASRRNSIQDLDAYFAVVLNRARRVHESLDAVLEVEPPVGLVALGGDCEETLDAPVIVGDEESDQWETLISPRSLRTSSGQKLSRTEVMKAMFAPGDGRVTRRSLMAESSASARRSFSPYYSSLPFAHVVFGCDIHSELHRNKTLIDNALTLLIGRQIN